MLLTFSSSNLLLVLHFFSNMQLCKFDHLDFKSQIVCNNVPVSGVSIEAWDNGKCLSIYLINIRFFSNFGSWVDYDNDDFIGKTVSDQDGKFFISGVANDHLDPIDVRLYIHNNNTENEIGEEVQIKIFIYGKKHHWFSFFRCD